MMHLRDIAAPLESSIQSRTANLQRVSKHTEDFLRTLPDRSVYTTPGAKDETMQAMQVSTGAATLEEALNIVECFVDGVGHNLGSGRFFAYIPSGSLHEAALADYIAAISNRYAGVGHAAPGVTRMDETLLRWLADVVGYPSTSEGDLTSGGSLAALSAIVTAREAFSITSQQTQNAVIYATSQTHHSFTKAVYVAGLGECVMREVAVDQDQRMNAKVLEKLIEQDNAAGLKPWFIAATAGTTNIGAVDPLNDIADIAAKHDVWLHVDAAYGGAFALCTDGKQRLSGLERSDSLILDPHKGFFLPCGTGVVLVRDGQKLYNAFNARGVYMQDVEEDPERSPCDLSAELTRPFRALRLWLPLKMHGTDAFAAALEEKLLLAQYFYEQVSAIPGIEVGSPPDLSIVPFRYVPKSGDADNYNRLLIDAIVADGRIFLSSTLLTGKFTLRMAILNYMTHLQDVDIALTVIKEKITALNEVST